MRQTESARACKQETNGSDERERAFFGENGIEAADGSPPAMPLPMYVSERECKNGINCDGVCSTPCVRRLSVTNVLSLCTKRQNGSFRSTINTFFHLFGGEYARMVDDKTQMIDKHQRVRIRRVYAPHSGTRTVGFLYSDVEYTTVQYPSIVHSTGIFRFQFIDSSKVQIN